MPDILPHLPEEIIADILLRLPLKSVGRFRSVSKPWLSLLTSYEFIKAHLAHHTHSLAHEQNILFHDYRSLFSLTLHLGGNHLRKLEFFDEKVRTLVGSCNGLVLVETKLNVLCLINCLTEEYVKLPVLDLQTRQVKYGFGYDSLSDDYKVVSISVARMNDKAITFVDIYSLKMRSWRRFGTFPYDLDNLSFNSGVFVNGALHWTRLQSSDNESPVIVAIDLNCEEFKEIRPPASIDNFKFRRLMVIDGCLGIAVQRFDDVYAEIWYMKSYSMVESWTKLVIDMQFTDFWYLHCCHKDKLLFEEDDGILKWYHLQDGRVDVCLPNEDRCYKLIDGKTYSQSLVSPHFHHRN